MLLHLYIFIISLSIDGDQNQTNLQWIKIKDASCNVKTTLEFKLKYPEKPNSSQTLNTENINTIIQHLKIEREQDNAMPYI